MSMSTNPAAQSTVTPWDVEASNSLKSAADAFIDGAKPHAEALAKAVSGVAVTTITTAGLPALRAGVALACPNAAPAANTVIDLSAAALPVCATQVCAPAIEPCV